MKIRYAISDFMAKDLITFNPDTPIETAIESFFSNKISGAPVVDEYGELVGVLYEKDCKRTLIEASYYNNLGGHVKEYMSTGVFTIDIHDTLSDVADRFMQSRFRRFSVTKGGKLAGQISRRDVLRAVDQLSKEDYSS